MEQVCAQQNSHDRETGCSVSAEEKKEKRVLEQSKRCISQLKCYVKKIAQTAENFHENVLPASLLE